MFFIQKSGIFGIAYKCPAGFRLKECPLKVIDHLTFGAKVSWINERDDFEVKKILIFHSVCTNNRNR